MGKEGGIKEFVGLNSSDWTGAGSDWIEAGSEGAGFGAEGEVAAKTIVSSPEYDVDSAGVIAHTPTKSTLLNTHAKLFSINTTLILFFNHYKA